MAAAKRSKARRDPDAIAAEIERLKAEHEAALRAQKEQAAQRLASAAERTSLITAIAEGRLTVKDLEGECRRLAQSIRERYGAKEAADQEAGSEADASADETAEPSPVTGPAAPILTGEADDETDTRGRDADEEVVS